MKLNILSIKEIEMVFNNISSHMIEKARSTIAEIIESDGRHCEIQLYIDRSLSPFVECKVLYSSVITGEQCLPGSFSTVVHQLKDIFQIILKALTGGWDNTPEGYIIFTMANYIKAYIDDNPQIYPICTLDEINHMINVTDGFSTIVIYGETDEEKLSLMDAISTTLSRYNTSIYYHKDMRNFMITVFSVNYYGETLRKFLDDIETPGNSYFDVI